MLYRMGHGVRQGLLSGRLGDYQVAQRRDLRRGCCGTKTKGLVGRRWPVDDADHNAEPCSVSARTFPSLFVKDFGFDLTAHASRYLKACVSLGIDVNYPLSRGVLPLARPTAILLKPT
jgi:hypothetical protein